jgi:hypothetical protein
VTISLKRRPFHANAAINHFEKLNEHTRALLRLILFNTHALKDESFNSGPPPVIGSRGNPTLSSEGLDEMFFSEAIPKSNVS